MSGAVKQNRGARALARLGFNLSFGMGFGGIRYTAAKQKHLNRSERFPTAALRLLRKAERLGQDKSTNTTRVFYRLGHALYVIRSKNRMTVATKNFKLNLQPDFQNLKGAC